MKAYCQFCDKTVEPIRLKTKKWNYYGGKYYLTICPFCGGNVKPNTQKRAVCLEVSGAPIFRRGHHGSKSGHAGQRLE